MLIRYSPSTAYYLLSLAVSYQRRSHTQPGRFLCLVEDYSLVRLVAVTAAAAAINMLVNEFSGTSYTRDSPADTAGIG